MDSRSAPAGSSQNNGPTLESLPTEIIFNILDLVFPAESPPIGETRPVAYDSLVPGEFWHTFTRGRRGLWSLCLVSRQFASLAQKLLYKTVAILDEDSLVLFFRTAFETGLSSLTRQFSCHLTLTRPGVGRNVRAAVAARLPAEMTRLLGENTRIAALPAEITHPAEIAHLPAEIATVDRTPEGIMLFLLVRLVRLETLSLQLPICDDHPDYVCLLSNLIVFRARQFPELTGGENTSYASVLTDLESAGNYDPVGVMLLESQLSHCYPIPSELTFMNLNTLLLQGDPELREYFEDDDGDGTHRTPETWGAQASRYMPLYVLFPKLTTLEISTDDGNWDMRGFFPNEGALLNNIRHVYLHDSIACPRNLGYILQCCPNLETLYMTPRVDETMDPNFLDEADSTEAHPESLNTALLKYGKKLRHLDVGWFETFGGTLIGPDGRLAALPRLPRLEKLCVPLAILYGTEVALVPLANLLPPNIIDLTLEDWWWTQIDEYDDMPDWNPIDRLEHYRSKRDYRTNALNSLVQFASDPASQPRLKTVLLLCHIPWTWIAEEGVPLDTHFTEVKEAFRLRGVEFLVDEA